MKHSRGENCPFETIQTIYDRTRDNAELTEQQLRRLIRVVRAYIIVRHKDEIDHDIIM